MGPRSLSASSNGAGGISAGQSESARTLGQSPTSAAETFQPKYRAQRLVRCASGCSLGRSATQPPGPSHVYPCAQQERPSAQQTPCPGSSSTQQPQPAAPTISALCVSPGLLLPRPRSGQHVLPSGHVKFRAAGLPAVPQSTMAEEARGVRRRSNSRGDSRIWVLLLCYIAPSLCPGRARVY